LAVARNLNPLSTKSGGAIGLTFSATSSETFSDIVSLVHGDSQRWEDYWTRNDGETRVVSAIGFLLRAGFVNSFKHAAMLTRAGLRKAQARLNQSRPKSGNKKASEASRM